MQSESVTTHIVESKRTGEGNWDEEIEDNVYFQYPEDSEADLGRAQSNEL